MQKIYTFICSNLLAAVEKRKEAEAQAWEGVTAWEQKAFLFWRCNKQPSRVIGQTQTRLFLAHPRCSPCLWKYENTCDKNLFRTKKIKIKYYWITHEKLSVSSKASSICNGNDRANFILFAIF